MPDPDYAIKVERADEEVLVIDGLAIARAFFEGDPSSVGANSYDAKAGNGNSERIEIADIETMNSTMRTRSAHKWWDDVVDVDFEWLREDRLPLDFDILRTAAADWAAADGDGLAEQAFKDVFGFQRALARVGKVLHLKRPCFFPVLDRLTAEMLGLTIPEQASKPKRVTLAQEMVALIRREGQENLDTLEAIKAVLDADGIERPLVRILDAMLWFSHPAAGVKDRSRAINVRLR